MLSVTTHLFLFNLVEGKRGRESIEYLVIFGREIVSISVAICHLCLSCKIKKQALQPIAENRKYAKKRNPWDQTTWKQRKEEEESGEGNIEKQNGQDL